jgi:hypothetical protein
VILNDEQGQYSLGLHLEILEVLEGKLTIDHLRLPILRKGLHLIDFQFPTPTSQLGLLETLVGMECGRSGNEVASEKRVYKHALRKYLFAGGSPACFSPKKNRDPLVLSHLEECGTFTQSKLMKLRLEIRTLMTTGYENPSESYLQNRPTN